MAVGVLSGVISELILIILALLIIYVIFKLGKVLLGVIVNIVLGFISIVVLNSFFALNIPWNLLTIIITALLGLPGVAVIVLLRLLGITL